MDQVLVELAKSGPWALVAGLLLYTVLQAWKQDRGKATELIGTFQSVLTDLKNEIHTDHVEGAKLLGELKEALGSLTTEIRTLTEVHREEKRDAHR